MNDKVNNVALFKHDNGQYYFAIYNADGGVRLRSEGFRTAQERDVELSGVLKNLNNDSMYSTISRGDYFIKVLKDKTGREVGRSCLQKTVAAPVVVTVAPVVETKAPVVEATTIVAAAAATVEPTVERVVVEPVKVERVTVEHVVETVVEVVDDYLACREYENRAITDAKNNVAVFKHTDDQHYFVIYNKGGTIRLRSEGFKTVEDLNVELTLALKHLDNESMYSILRRGEYYLKVLKDETGREVGRGCLQKDVAPPPVVVAAPIVAAVAAAVVAPRNPSSS